MGLLIHLSISPWSEKARWALDHHRVPHRRVAHLPMLGEPVLRIFTRKFRGRVTVPVYLDGARVIADSYDIARHADRVGAGAPLFPAGRDDETERWNTLAETVLSAGRALGVVRSRVDPRARAESVPAFVPHALRPAIDPLVRAGFDHIAQKYGAEGTAHEDARNAIRRGLSNAREALGGRPYLLGDFSFADIAIAASLQGVQPVEHPRMPLGPGTRAAWTDPTLAREFADLLAWRDDLYARHR